MGNDDGEDDERRSIALYEQYDEEKDEEVLEVARKLRDHARDLDRRAAERNARSWLAVELRRLARRLDEAVDDFE